MSVEGDIQPIVWRRRGRRACSKYSPRGSWPSPCSWPGPAVEHPQLALTPPNTCHFLLKFPIASLSSDTHQRETLSSASIPNLVTFLWRLLTFFNVFFTSLSINVCHFLLTLRRSSFSSEYHFLWCLPLPNNCISCLTLSSSYYFLLTLSDPSLSSEIFQSLPLSSDTL